MGLVERLQRLVPEELQRLQAEINRANSAYDESLQGYPTLYHGTPDTIDNFELSKVDVVELSDQL